MDYLELLQQIFQVCVIPLLGVLTTFIIKWINVKAQELAVKNDNALHQKYIKMLADTISDCVTATNQTYVNALKDKNAFDKEAQEEAFNQTYNAVISILSQDAQEYLTSAYGDLNTYVKEKIEAEVNKEKVASAAASA